MVFSENHDSSVTLNTPSKKQGSHRRSWSPSYESRNVRLVHFAFINVLKLLSTLKTYYSSAEMKFKTKLSLESFLFFSEGKF